MPCIKVISNNSDNNTNNNNNKVQNLYHGKYKYKPQNSCNIMYLGKIVCFRYIIVSDTIITPKSITYVIQQDTQYCVSCWITYILKNDTRSIQYQIT